MTEYTAKEIAGLLGKTKQAVQKRAAKESWPFVEQAVRGGKQRLYPYESLPEAVRVALSPEKEVQAVSTVPTVPVIKIIIEISIATPSKAQ